MLSQGGLARGLDLYQSGSRGNAIYQGLRNIFPSAWFKSIRALGSRVFGAVKSGMAFIGGQVLKIQDIPVDPQGMQEPYQGLGMGRIRATVRYRYRDKISHRRVYRSTIVNAESLEELQRLIDSLPDYLANLANMGGGSPKADRLPGAANIHIDSVSITRRA